MGGAGLVIGLLMAAAACERLPRMAEAGDPGTLPVESLPNAVEIPAAWGALVSVTHPSWADRTSLLWFQDERGVVRVASYDHVARRFRTGAGVVRRTP
jgi:hypothetical protein